MIMLPCMFGMHARGGLTLPQGCAINLAGVALAQQCLLSEALQTCMACHVRLHCQRHTVDTSFLQQQQHK